MELTRRDLGKLALAAIPASTLLAKPNSKIDGVQVGAITYCYRAMPGYTKADELLKYIVDSGISAVELMSQAAEFYAGSPAANAPAGGGGRGRNATPEQQAAARERAEALKKWRLSVSMDKYKAFRKMYNDAGVSIYAFKLPPTPAMSDEEYEYIFHVAETLGANHVTLELSTNLEFTKRLGDFAAKKKMLVAYHNHAQGTITAWDAVLEQSKGNALNLDCGHYVEGAQESPIPLMRKHAGRIASMHLKDSKKSANGGDIVPWGQGDTPIAEILQTMRKEKYKFPVSIEYEYQTPEGSTPVLETAKCLQFCRKALA